MKISNLVIYLCVGIFISFTLLFFAKIAGIVQWSWWIIFSPVIFSVAALMIMMFCVFVLISFEIYQVEEPVIKEIHPYMVNKHRLKKKYNETSDVGGKL